jgi:hypothetical protein
VLQQLAIMTEQEMFNFFIGYLVKMKAVYPDPADQEQPRRTLEEFVRERTAALEAAMEKLARAEKTLGGHRVPG